MNEQNFEQFLYEEVSHLPPAPLPKPWSGPLRRICWGIVLNTIKLNFLGLSYLLPSIGMVLLWLGFRSLRQENGWFRFAFGLSSLLTLWQLTSCVLYATPVSIWMADLVYTIAAVHAVPTLLLYLSLWRGLRGVFVAQGRTPKSGAAGGLLIWQFLITVLSFIGVSGWIIVLPILILWLLLIRSVYRINRSLDNAGYGLHLAPTKVNDRHAALLWLGISAALLVICMLCSQRITMETTVAEHAPTTQNQLRAELVELGFPKEVLDDLADEEVSLLEDAVSVTVSSYAPESSAKLEIDLLESQFIQVQLPGDVLRYFFWFSWSETPKHRLMECLEITPVLQQGTVTVPHDSFASGRLLWSENGQSKQAILASSALSGYTKNNGLFGSADYNSYVINFSLPKEGEHIRGYVTWWARPTHPSTWTNYNVEAFYIHQASLFNYPWHTPAQYQRIVWNNRDRLFPARQHWALFRYGMNTTQN